MLTRAQEKLIRSLQTKKGREKSGRCLVEGQKVIDLAGPAVEFTFRRTDTEDFAKLVSTETPQDVAAVAKIPEWNDAEITSKRTVVLLDGVQDPGNVGAILRLCLGFHASLLLVESADVTNPKVVRSSVGALFQVPWKKLDRASAETVVRELNREVYRLEARPDAISVDTMETKEPAILIAGSEGSGIQLPVEGTSLKIEHDAALESLNVGHALAVALYLRSR